MRLSAFALLVVFLFAACGGNENSTDTTKTGDTGKKEDRGISALKPPTQAEALKPPADPEAAAFAKAEQQLRSSDPEDRMMAIETVRDLKDRQKAGQMVAKLLMDPDEGVRSVAAEAIGTFEYPPAVANLRTLLSGEKSDSVRKQALESLYTLAKTDAVPDLIKALTDETEGSLRATAADLLGRLGDARAVDPLIKSLSNEFDESVQLQDVTALHRLRAAKAVDAVIDALQFSSVLVRAEAAKTLGDLGEKKAVKPLIAALTPDEDGQVILADVTSLGKLTGTTDKSMLLTSDDSGARQTAVVDAWKKWWEENKSKF